MPLAPGLELSQMHATNATMDIYRKIHKEVVDRLQEEPAFKTDQGKRLLEHLIDVGLPELEPQNRGKSQSDFHVRRAVRHG